jgi:hypothetical protein
MMLPQTAGLAPTEQDDLDGLRLKAKTLSARAKSAICARIRLSRDSTFTFRNKRLLTAERYDAAA